MPLHLSRRSFLVASAGAAALRAENGLDVELVNAPAGALQPQAVVDDIGVVHLIYLYGDPGAADIGYVRMAPGDKTFESPLRVNSQPGSAIALGTVRGAHLAIGRAGRVHVAWNGSSSSEPKGPNKSEPMLYARLNDRKNAFEPQRSVMTFASGLDGGGTVAADLQGNVFVTWHAQGQKNGMPVQGEGSRRVWLARSSDDRGTFEAETPVSPAELGACGCCGMGALSDDAGHLFLLYRTARETVHRDMYLLISRDGGKSFEAIDLHPWEIGACPMSTVSLVSANGKVLVAWETAKQVYFASINAQTLTVGTPVAAPGEGMNRKHPSIAIGRNGETLLVWTEGTGWKKGGSLAWQRFDEKGLALGTMGALPGLPAWNFATAVWAKDRFVVIF
jgi:hypothetical protein